MMMLVKLFGNCRWLLLASVTLLLSFALAYGGNVITIPKGEAEYVIGIGSRKRPGDDLEVPPGGRSIVMTGANGATFKCVLPNPELYEEPEDAQEDIAEQDIQLPQDVLQKSQRSGKKFLEGVPQKIAAHLKGGCFTRTKDYWTYEVCPFRKVTQYHVENTQRATEFSLGTYVDQTHVTQINTGLYTQKFERGSAGRQTKVKFVCYDEELHDPQFDVRDKATDEEKADIARAKLKGDIELNHVLVAMEETQTLHYEMVVATDLACDVAAMGSMFPQQEGKMAQMTPPGGASLEMQLISALGGDCMFLIEGWWTYKVCIGEEITQYHSEREVDSKATKDSEGNTAVKVTETIVQSYVLGRYDSMDKNSVTMMDLGSWDENYIRTTYENGEICDLSGKPRTTELRLRCDPQDLGTVTDVTEVGTCTYVIDIKSPVMCNHPRMKPEKPKIFEIKCVLLEDSSLEINVAS